MKQKKLIIGLIIGAVMGLGITVWASNAYSDIQPIVVNGDYYAGELKIDDIVSLVIERMGEQASGVAEDVFGNTRFTHGLEVPSGQTFTNAGTLTQSGTATLSGDTSISGALTISRNATTTLPRMYAPIHIDLDISATSTSDHYGTSSPDYWCNTGSDLLIWDWNGAILTNQTTFRGNWRIGTTTLRNSTVASSWTAANSWTSTNTATIMGPFGGYNAAFTSTTRLIFDRDSVANLTYRALTGQTGLGQYYTEDPTNQTTSTPWLLKHGDCILVRNDHLGATSSASYATDGGATAMDGFVNFFATLVGNE